MAIYSWRTTKTGLGYAFTVVKIAPRTTANDVGHYADTTTVKAGTAVASRDVAKRAAQKWVRYFRALDRKAA